MGAENDMPVLPLETQLRMALIQEQHLSKEYAYMKSIVASHERELAWLSLVVVILGCMNYYLLTQVSKESHNGNRT